MSSTTALAPLPKTWSNVVLTYSKPDLTKWYKSVLLVFPCRERWPVEELGSKHRLTGTNRSEKIETLRLDRLPREARCVFELEQRSSPPWLDIGLGQPTGFFGFYFWSLGRRLSSAAERRQSLLEVRSWVYNWIGFGLEFKGPIQSWAFTSEEHLPKLPML